MVRIPHTYTVESVTSGHPDKVCDQVSDAILDAHLAEDPSSRVAVETFGSHGLFVIGGEVTSKTPVDYEKIAREQYKKIGYTDELRVVAHVARQSPDIAMGVDTGGAGDQGIMYGYATNETPEYLPRAVVLVHKLTKGLEDLRRSGKILWLGPDGKSQVTMENGNVSTVLVSAQHADSVSQEEIQNELTEKLIHPLLTSEKDVHPRTNNIGEGVNILVNPTGRFVQGGFMADAGLTGRKIMVDTYGGIIPHGGGAFSGKDPSKVDRSAAYMARFVAKNIVANGHAKSCLVSVSYAIGRAEPLMVEATDETGNNISKSILEKFDFRPKAIIERLNLRKPIYAKTAAYGHFGNPEFSWEQIIALESSQIPRVATTNADVL